MTSNVLPLHFAPSQASSSQNSNVDDKLEGYKIKSKSALSFKIFLTLFPMHLFAVQNGRAEPFLFIVYLYLGT